MKTLQCVALTALALLLFPAANGMAQSAANAAPVNELSAGLGSCSAQLSISSPDGKPVYAAKVEMRIQYGLMGVKKLDLEAYSDQNGKLTITQLPLVLKKPIYIHVTKNDKEQILEFKPESGCQAKFNVVLY